MGLIEDAVEEQARRNHEAIERAVERMLVMPGDYGVLVTHRRDGTVECRLTHRVPPMEVAHFTE